MTLRGNVGATDMREKEKKEKQKVEHTITIYIRNNNI